MTDLKKVNKWSAEKCGAELVIPYTGMHKPNFIYKGKEYYYQWTLNDARCREIVREHFKIHINYMLSGRVICGAHPYGGEFLGNSSKEAEIACIIAIMESEND